VVYSMIKPLTIPSHGRLKNVYGKFYPHFQTPAPWLHAGRRRRRVPDLRELGPDLLAIHRARQNLKRCFFGLKAGAGSEMAIWRKDVL
jgi:hypothetical protein